MRLDQCGRIDRRSGAGAYSTGASAAECSHVEVALIASRRSRRRRHGPTQHRASLSAEAGEAARHGQERGRPRGRTAALNPPSSSAPAGHVARRSRVTPRREPVLPTHGDAGTLDISALRSERTGSRAHHAFSLPSLRFLANHPVVKLLLHFGVGRSNESIALAFPKSTASEVVNVASQREGKIPLSARICNCAVLNGRVNEVRYTPARRIRSSLVRRIYAEPSDLKMSRGWLRAECFNKLPSAIASNLGVGDIGHHDRLIAVGLIFGRVLPDPVANPTRDVLLIRLITAGELLQGVAIVSRQAMGTKIYWISTRRKEAARLAAVFADARPAGSHQPVPACSYEAPTA